MFSLKIFSSYFFLSMLCIHPLKSMRSMSPCTSHSICKAFVDRLKLTVVIAFYHPERTEKSLALN